MTQPDTEIQLQEQNQNPDPAFSGPQESVNADSSDAAPDTGEGSVPRIGTLSTERLSDTIAARGPLQPTAVDSGGVERIVGPAVDDSWVHRSGDPDPDEIARLEAVRADQLAYREERLGATQAPAANLAGGHEVSRAALAAERGE